VANTVRYARRFGLVYFLLAVVVGIAAGTTINLVRDGDHNRSPWSAWKPTAPPELRPKEIASRVAAAYRLSNGRRLVDVVTGDPFQSAITEVATPAVGAGLGRDTPVYDPSRMRMFILCGQGKNCSVPGTPSVERTLLLHREAVELALYTFKYVDGMKSVIAFMPPPAGTQAQYVVYLEKSDVADRLKVPLLKTLGAKVPLPSAIPSKEQETVDATTEPRVYKYSLSQAQQGDAILVLAPLTA
jgi:hypothetical protein